METTEPPLTALVDTIEQATLDGQDGASIKPYMNRLKERLLAIVGNVPDLGDTPILQAAWKFSSLCHKYHVLMEANAEESVSGALEALRIELTAAKQDLLDAIATG